MLRLMLAAHLAAAPIPLERGTFWEYRESYTEPRGELDATTDELTRFEVRGTPEHPFLHQSGGSDPSPGPVEIGEGFMVLGPWTGEDGLPLPLKLGRVGPRIDGAAAWTVEEEEEVEVPAGRFLALRCALRAPGAVAILWIVPGIGIVREAQGTGERGRRPLLERLLLRYGGPKEARGGPVRPPGAPRPAR